MEGVAQCRIDVGNTHYTIPYGGGSDIFPSPGLFPRRLGGRSRASPSNPRVVYNYTLVN
jgi:hypothetical protein